VGPFFEGSDYEAGWELARKENIDIVDEHYYVNPGWYIHSQNYYDKYDRKGTKVYLGEWASRGNQLENALAEALHITNLERNADVVIMSSYAPLLAKHGHTQWNPDLIYFNNTSVMPTVNYQVQKLCGNNSGSQYIYSNLKVDAISMERNQEVARYNEAASKRISSSVVKDEKTGDLILKLVNITPVPADLQIDFDNWEGYASEAELSVISGNPSDRDNKPNQTTLSVSEKFSYQLPAYSFSVIRLKKNH
jgi:alpha-L-arabinofuranosidase